MKKDFSSALKECRARTGMTQAELAALLEVSPRALWQWEDGKVPHILTQEGARSRMQKLKGKS